jgi:hypothetical protein
MTNQSAAGIVNYHRIPSSKGNVDSNTLCYMFQTAMRAFDYEFAEKKMVNGIEEVVMKEWTNHLHTKYNLKDKNRPWNSKDLTLFGAMPQAKYFDKDAVMNVPFMSLAQGVKRFPSVARGDGANLTRCVQYAVAHPREVLLFPQDFASLTRRLGATLIRDEHYDCATFKRWKRGQAPNPPGRVIPPLVFASGMSAPAQASGSAAVTRRRSRVTKVERTRKKTTPGNQPHQIQFQLSRYQHVPAYAANEIISSSTEPQHELPVVEQNPFSDDFFNMPDFFDNSANIGTPALEENSYLHPATMDEVFNAGHDFHDGPQSWMASQPFAENSRGYSSDSMGLDPHQAPASATNTPASDPFQATSTPDMPPADNTMYFAPAGDVFGMGSESGTPHPADAELWWFGG